MPALKVHDLHKRFGEVEVLKGVNLDAHVGDVISMLGASGSGKSTFLRCINLLETPDSGSISVQGETIEMTVDRAGSPVPTDMDQVIRLRARLGMVFQSFNLWQHMTVLENVIEAPVHVLKVNKKKAIERAEQVLQRVGMIERKDFYPAHLSGGQQQRAAIARALAMEPEMMLFDEPTSALDPETEQRLVAALREASAGRVVLVIAHRLSTVRAADQILFVEAGRIVERGAHDELMARPGGAYRRYVELQTRGAA